MDGQRPGDLPRPLIFGRAAEALGQPAGLGGDGREICQPLRRGGGREERALSVRGDLYTVAVIKLALANDN